MAHLSCQLRLTAEATVTRQWSSERRAYGNMCETPHIFHCDIRHWKSFFCSTYFASLLDFIWRGARVWGWPVRLGKIPLHQLSSVLTFDTTRIFHSPRLFRADPPLLRRNVCRRCKKCALCPGVVTGLKRVKNGWSRIGSVNCEDEEWWRWSTRREKHRDDLVRRYVSPQLTMRVCPVNLSH